MLLKNQLVNEEIKSTTSHRSEWPSFKKATNNKCWRDSGRKGNVGGNVIVATATMETSREILFRKNLTL